MSGTGFQSRMDLRFQARSPAPDFSGRRRIKSGTWPSRLLYLDDHFRFGTALRGLCRDTGLSASLESSAMAFPAVFPQAPSREAGRWMKKTRPHAQWRRHSADWVRRLVDAIRPKVVIVFGAKVSEVLNINWEDAEHVHKQGHQTFGLSTFRGSPAVYCHHLSQGCPMSEARKCFQHAKRLILDRKSSS